MARIGNRSPRHLDGESMGSTLRDLFDGTPKAALFDALLDLVALRHPESADAGAEDRCWLHDEAELVLKQAGWGPRKVEK